MQGHIAFGAGGDHRFDAKIVEFFDIEAGQPHEIFPVTRPEQIMAAAPLVGQQARGDIEKVQESQAIEENPVGFHLHPLAEKDIIIWSTTAKKEDGAFRVNANLFG